MLRALSCLAVIVTSLLGFAGAAPGQIVWYVDDNAASDPGPGDNSISDPMENGTIEHPFDRIQEAVGAAFPGHIVRVLPGTYLESVNLLGKAITLESTGGASQTTIDAQGAGSAIRCSTNEGPSTIIDGFRVQGGTGTSLAGYPVPNGGKAGGGMFNWAASPTVRNCVIINNSADANTGGAGYGGGMANFNGSSPAITSCQFIDNFASGMINGYGAGMVCSDNSNPTITNCRFENNWVAGHFNGFGGGLGVGGGCSPVVTNCEFVNNLATGNTLYGYGAGVFVGNGGVNNPQFTNCRFLGNESEEFAGGLYVDGTSPGVLVIDCVFDGNSALLDGGAVRVDAPSMPAFQGTRFCDSAPEHIAGAWQDLGGNSFSALGCCPADIDDSGTVDVTDLLLVISLWGNPGGLGGVADINQDGFVNVTDLLAVISAWGNCP